jgi:MscS family membrane protein
MQKSFRLLCSIFVFVVSPFFLWASVEPEKDITFDLSSPQNTLLTFDYFTKGENYSPKTASKTLNAKGYSEKEREVLVVRLRQIIDGMGLVVDYETVPNDRKFLDSSSNRYRYVPFKEVQAIYLERLPDGRWLFSEKTVQAITRLHKQVYPLGLDKILEILPKSSKKIIGLAAWQYLALTVMAIVAWLGFRFFLWFVRIILVRSARKMGAIYSVKAIIRKAVYPLGLLFITTLLYLFLPVLQLPPTLLFYLLLTIRVAIPVFIGTSLYYFTDLLSLYLAKQAEKTTNRFDDNAVPLIRRSIKFTIVLICFFFVLSALGVNIAALLTGLSIGGLALALAAQDTIKNLFGSLMIFLDQPFKIGDWIVSEKIDGEVEEIGFRSTRIRTFYDSIIHIPNGNLANMTIDNLGLRRYRRYRTFIHIQYNTPPEKITAFTQGIYQIIMQRADTRKDFTFVELNELGQYSLQVLLFMFFEVPDMVSEMKARAEVNLAIVQLAQELGVKFAMPTQTLHIESLPASQLRQH